MTLTGVDVEQKKPNTNVHVVHPFIQSTTQENLIFVVRS